jgi:hypothetical protein
MRGPSLEQAFNFTAQQVHDARNSQSKVMIITNKLADKHRDPQIRDWIINVGIFAELTGLFANITDESVIEELIQEVACGEGDPKKLLVELTRLPAGENVPGSVKETLQCEWECIADGWTSRAGRISNASFQGGIY